MRGVNKNTGVIARGRAARRLGVLCGLGLALVLGCTGAGALADGSWTGESGRDEQGAYGVVTILVKEGKIDSCGFLTYQKDGSVKAEDYGKINGEISNADFYARAQLAVRAMKQYENQYNEAKSLDAVQAVSGATIAYDQFREAVEEALEKARGAAKR
jgi:major membrane immunogen (membrane-anchored lipoprotein)